MAAQYSVRISIAKHTVAVLRFLARVWPTVTTPKKIRPALSSVPKEGEQCGAGTEGSLQRCSSVIG